MHHCDADENTLLLREHPKDDNGINQAIGRNNKSESENGILKTLKKVFRKTRIEHEILGSDLSDQVLTNRDPDRSPDAASDNSVIETEYFETRDDDAEWSPQFNRCPSQSLCYDYCFVWPAFDQVKDEAMTTNEYRDAILRIITAREDVKRGIMEIRRRNTFEMSSVPSYLRVDEMTRDGSITKKQFCKTAFELIVNFLKLIGCELYAFYASDRKSIFLKARLKETGCVNLAHSEHYLVQLDSPISINTFHIYPIDNICSKEEHSISPYSSFSKYAEDKEIGFKCLQTYDKVWQRYDENGMKINDYSLESRDSDTSQIKHSLKNDNASIFRPIDRIRLINRCVQSHFNTSAMLNEGCLLDWFPLHQPIIQHNLRKNWARMTKIPILDQPMDIVRLYYGENIVFYFSWMQFFCNELVLPAIIGILVFVAQMYLDHKATFQNKYVCALSVIYSFYLSLWSANLTFKWRLKEAFLELEWGVSYDESQEVNPQYEADSIRRDDLKPFSYIRDYSETKTLLRRVVSSILSWTFLLGILMCIAIVSAIRIFFYFEKSNIPYIEGKEDTILSVIMSLQILIFEFLWYKLAEFLTNLENHPFEEDRYISAALKMFSFQYINNFSSFFYDLYLKPYISTGDVSNCDLQDLRLQLVLIFCVNIVFNAIEVGMPILKFWRRRRRRKKFPKSSFTEVQSDLQSYDPVFDVLEDFMEIAISFCFVTLFSCLFPIIPALALMWGAVEMRSDAFKIVVVHKRAFPSLAKGIGPWKDLLLFSSFVSILNNVAVGVYSMNLFDDMSPSLRLKIFLLAEHVMIALCLAVRWSYSEKLREIRQLQSRLQTLVRHCIYGHPERSLARNAPFGIFDTELETELMIKSKDLDRQSSYHIFRIDESTSG